MQAEVTEDYIGNDAFEGFKEPLNYVQITSKGIYREFSSGSKHTENVFRET